jgi:hypothetical protein
VELRRSEGVGVCTGRSCPTSGTGGGAERRHESKPVLKGAVAGYQGIFSVCGGEAVGTRYGAGV